VNRFLGNQIPRVEQQDKITINLKAKEGDKINIVLANLLQALSKKFICNLNSNIKFNRDIFINNISYEEARKFFTENYDIIFEEDRNKKLLIKSPEGYWCTYQLDFPNYTYKMSSAMIQESNYSSGDRKSLINYNISGKKRKNKSLKRDKNMNHEGQMSYIIENNSNVWEEIEDNLKIISEKYFINRNSGIVSIFAKEREQEVVKALLAKIQEKNRFFFEITIQFWVISSNRNHHKNPLFLNGNFMDFVENKIKSYLPNSPIDPNIRDKTSFGELIYEDEVMDIKMSSENKILTMNNQAVFYKNHREEIRSKDSLETAVIHSTAITKTNHIREKYNDGITFYIHPVLKNKDIVLVYFVPMIIDRAGNNIFYNKSLSSTFFIKPNNKVLLGGFSRQRVERGEKHIPWFSKIFFLKYFFTQKSTRTIMENTVITISIKINKI
jgi:hypothetical protein